MPLFFLLKNQCSWQKVRESRKGKPDFPDFMSNFINSYFKHRQLIYVNVFRETFSNISSINDIRITIAHNIKRETVATSGCLEK